ncbi:hypothetical protein FI667_g16334, partial [Globisporangium splendens]
MCSNAALPTLAQVAIGSVNTQALNSQIGSTQNGANGNANAAGNAMVQPFARGDQLTGEFVNDISVASNPEDRSAQLTVSDFQNAGFSAADAALIVANLNVGSNNEAVVHPINVAPNTSGSVAAGPAVPETTAPATDAPSPTPSHQSLSLSPSAAAEATSTPAPSTPLPPTASPTTNAATAFSVNLQASSTDSDDSSSKSSSSSAGAATLILGGGGCVLAVAAAAFVYRKKKTHPKTPGTPAEKKAAYFHCEVRLTPPAAVVYVV